MQQQRWLALMQTFGLPANQDCYHKLVQAYSEKHRHYHNQQHIDACLHWLDQAKHLSENPHLVELAIWFHDAVYKIFSGNNEADSAHWAEEFLRQNRVGESTIAKLKAMILATRHNAPADDPETQLLADIDLSIHGSPTEEFDAFENNIRKEYILIPGFIYRSKRRDILSGFLQRSRIFHLELFYERLEQQARLNLKNAIASLAR